MPEAGRRPTRAQWHANFLPPYSDVREEAMTAMAWELDGQTSTVAQALSDGAPHRLGSFRFFFDEQRWEWSEQLQRMHGYEPGTVEPTTELVLSHKHPDDRGHVAAVLADILRTRRAFSNRHRIVDSGGRVRHVVVVGDQLLGNRGDVIGTHGFYVDVTPVPERAQQDLVTAKLAEIAENRAGIEQAKGMLMLVYGIDDEAAFDLLRWLSQESNTKLRALAEQIVADFCGVPHAVRSQSEFDQLLLTASTRVGRR